MIKKVAIFISALLLFGFSSTISFGESEFNANKDNRLFIGAGYDNATGRLLDECISYKEVLKFEDEGAKEIVYDLILIESTEALENALNIGVAASYGKIVSGKARFVKNVKINNYSVYGLVQVKVVTPSSVLKRIRLEKEFVDLASSNPEKFRKICGSEYVVALSKGGELNALIEISTKSKTEKQNISAELSGGIGLFKASGDLSKSLSKVLGNKNVKLHVTLSGTQGESPLPSNIDNLILFAENFPKSSFKFPSPYFAYTREYDRIINYPDVSPWDAKDQIDIMRRLSKLRVDYISKLNDIEYILNNSEQFINPNISKLNKYRNEINKSLNKLNQYGRKCFQDLLNCEYPTDIDYLEIELPARKENISICKLMRHEVCGVEKYKLKESENCPPLLFVEKEDPKCGPLLYKKLRTENCPVEVWKKGAGPVCGEEHADYLKHDIPYGPDPKTAANQVCKNLGYLRGEVLRVNSEGGSGYGGDIDMRCFKYRQCRDPQFGPARYADCRSPNHPVEKWRICRDVSFGVEKYSQCRHEKHGPESYFECYVNPLTGEKCTKE